MMQFKKTGRPSWKDIFVVNQGDRLTSQQLDRVIDYYGQKIGEVAEIRLAVVKKNGDTEVLEF